VTYAVDFTAAAARELRKLPAAVRSRILEAVSALEREPRPTGARRLAASEPAWRIRVGTYRVIYEVSDDRLTVTVVRAAHRREVYRRR
jgi:mRNA interferase RelE/StbE